MKLRRIDVITISIFITGAILVAAHYALPSFPFSEFLRDIGMVLGPIGLVSFLYEFRLRQEFLKTIQQMFPGYFAANQAIDLRERQMSEIINSLSSARHEVLLMGGNLRLLAFYTNRLAEVFAAVKIVRVLIMDGTCEAARMRERQIGSTGNWDYGRLFNETKGAVREIREKLGPAAAKLQVHTYELPAMHFLCIIDDQRMILNSYPFGSTGIEFPHLYFDACDTDPISNGMMRRYRESFEFVWNNRSKPLILE